MGKQVMEDRAGRRKRRVFTPRFKVDRNDYPASGSVRHPIVFSHPHAIFYLFGTSERLH